MRTEKHESIKKSLNKGCLTTSQDVTCDADDVVAADDAFESDARDATWAAADAAAAACCVGSQGPWCRWRIGSWTGCSSWRVPLPDSPS